MPLQPITSRDNPLLVRIRKLVRDPNGYRKAGLIWVEGDHLLRAALARGVRLQTLVVDEKAVDRFADLIAGAHSAVSVPGAMMKSLSGLESAAPVAGLLPWAGGAAVQPDLPTVVLDRVQDAGNVGSILRSAAAFGFSQVIAITGTASPWSPKALRAAMGAHFALSLVEQAGERDMDALRVPLVATSSHADAALHDAPLPWPCGWVFGHEGQGVSGEIARRCAMMVRIPQPGGEESLNVAAAAAICLYESARARL